MYISMPGRLCARGVARSCLQRLQDDRSQTGSCQPMNKEKTQKAFENQVLSSRIGRAFPESSA